MGDDELKKDLSDREGKDEKQGGTPSPKKKGGLLIGVLLAIIFLLVLAVIFFATPLKEMVLAEKTAPTVTLKLINEPVVTEEGFYLFEVEANAQGNPEPEVTFNRDDSMGEAGKNRAQIILKGGESFTIMVTAANPRGKDTASLDLEAGAEEEPPPDPEPDPEPEPEPEPEPPSTPAANNPPAVAAINFDPSGIYTGWTYIVTADSSDPDGDSLTYEWSATGGSITGANTNPMTWKAPDTTGNYTISVTVRDGRGGVSTRSQEVTVSTFIFRPLPLLPFNPLGTTVTLSPFPGQSGFIVRDSSTHTSAPVFVGDSHNNKPIRGYVSFDISGLAGKTVKKVELTMNPSPVFGNPWAFLSGLWVGVVRLTPLPGDRALAVDDYNLAGVGIHMFSGNNISIVSEANDDTTKKLAVELQKDINESRNRFLLRLHFANEKSDFDNLYDAVPYLLDHITLKVTY
jgi:hypothetical protein